VKALAPLPPPRPSLTCKGKQWLLLILLL
jgi:hypothetical protein